MSRTGKLILLVGVAASGKSTYAKEEWEKDPKNIVLVSRDSIRQLLFGYSDASLHKYYERRDIVGREKAVTENMDEFIRFNLGKGKRVIVDNTHLKMSYLNLYQKFNVQTTVIVKNETVSSCIERDSKRVKAVGQKVIMKQSKQFDTLYTQLDKEYNLVLSNGVIEDFKFTTYQYQYEPNIDLASCVVVDIDGTVAEKGDRSPYDMNSVDKDTEKTAITNVVRALKEANYPIVICTGRDGTGAEKSKQWLIDNKIPFDRFYIRKAGDMRPDFIVKEEMWMEIIKEFNIMTMIDDRAQVYNHARSLGFTVMDVAGHTF